MADSKNSWVAVLTAVTALIGPLAGFGGTATEDHRAAERHFWDQQIRVGKRLNWITGVASAAGVLGLIFVGLGLRESRYATVASNRGWLATEQATLAYQLALNEPIEYIISFKNTGRSPVTDQGWSIDYGTIQAPAKSKDGIIDFNDVHMSDNKTCDHLYPTDTNDVVYPGDDGGRNLHTAEPKKLLVVDQAIISGAKYAYFRGCIAYHTMGIVGKSGYCFIIIRFTDMGGLVQEIHKCQSGLSAE
jgi:hypothetical protein